MLAIDVAQLLINRNCLKKVLLLKIRGYMRPLRTPLNPWLHIVFIFKYWNYKPCWCHFEESNYLRCCKIPKGYSCNSSKSVITPTLLKLHQLSTTPEYLRVGSWSKKCQKMIEQKQQEVTSIRHRNHLEKSIFIDVKISTSNRCHNFPVDSPFKIDVISTNFPRGILTWNRWRIDKDVSIGLALPENNLIQKFILGLHGFIFNYIFLNFQISIKKNLVKRKKLAKIVLTNKNNPEYI